jgi:membrane protein DedA with SNARE-associated domain
MDTLNTPTSQPIWNTVLRYGSYCAGAMVFFSLLSYLTNFNMMSLSGIIILYLVLFAIGFTFAALAMRHQRDQLDGGYIGYGKALAIGLLTVMIGMFVSGLWNYVLVNFIDPNIVATLKEQFMEGWGKNMPPEALEKALEGFDKAGELGTNLINSLTSGGFVGLIVGLITAAFMKKQPEISIR